MANFYDEIAPSYDALYKEEQMKKLSLIKGLGIIDEKDDVLDVGCGTGFSLDYFKANMTGVDPAAKLLEKYTGKKNILKAKAEELPFKDHKFDLVMSVTAIQNFDDIYKGLKEMERVGQEKFVFTVQKRSPKLSFITDCIKEVFKKSSIQTMDEGKDLVFIVKKS